MYTFERALENGDMFIENDTLFVSVDKGIYSIDEGDQDYLRMIGHIYYEKLFLAIDAGIDPTEVVIYPIQNSIEFLDSGSIFDFTDTLMAYRLYQLIAEIVEPPVMIKFNRDGNDITIIDQRVCDGNTEQNIAAVPGLMKEVYAAVAWFGYPCDWVQPAL